jgi:Icc protein
MKNHKVVQITDTHLFESPDVSRYGVNSWRTLQAVVADVAANHPDFDAVLLTGDLSQDETPGSYELLKEALAPLRTAPFYAIPGNHDNLEYMRSRLEESDFFVFRDAHLDGWRVAMLNSQVPGQVHGELGAAQIDRLAASLRGADEHVIVAMHHPPVAIDSAWLDRLRCLDGEQLLAVLTNPPVKAVVCGHVHQNFEGKAGGIPILTTPSTCAQFTPAVPKFDVEAAAAPGYRVFELERDGRWSSSVCRVTVGAPGT